MFYVQYLTKLGDNLVRMFLSSILYERPGGLFAPGHLLLRHNNNQNRKVLDPILGPVVRKRAGLSLLSKSSLPAGGHACVIYVGQSHVKVEFISRPSDNPGVDCSGLEW